MTVAFHLNLVKCLSKYCRVLQDTPEGPPLLRIGELSRLLGMRGHVLRAWEGVSMIAARSGCAWVDRSDRVACAGQAAPGPGRDRCPPDRAGRRTGPKVGEAGSGGASSSGPLAHGLV